MDLRTIWFILIGVLFTGFFFLEGFDFGVGILLPFLGKNDRERRMIINTIGPFWDGNEVWLITAGGAIFAAFPNWYSTMFSGFYPAMLIVLAALIFRGVSFEFRGKNESKSWRNNWDRIFFISNLILPILWGTALANLIKGVPIDKTMNYVGGFMDLLSPYTLMAGITVLLVFIFHGSIFLSLKTRGIIEERAVKASKILGLLALASSLILVIFTSFQTDLYKSTAAHLASVAALLLVAASWYAVTRHSAKTAMLLNGLSIIGGMASLFLGLFPRVMVSSINPGFDLTIYNASSSGYTLSLMTNIALIFVPFVLAYQIWTYWIFRKRVSAKDLEY